MTLPLGGGLRPIHLTQDPERQFWGKHRGKVTKTNDPLMRGRIKCRIPYPLGEIESEWCEPCFPPGHFIPPAVDDGVWVEFENGDVNQPIWVGFWYRASEAPFQAVSDTLQDNDEEGFATTTEKEEHKPFHDHGQQQYYSPHVRAWKTPSGHYLLFDDWEGEGDKRGLVILSDRDGRMLVLSEQGYIDVYAGNDIWIRVDAGNDKVIVNATNVYLGDEANAQPLMTKADADSIKAALDALKTHTHGGVSTGGGTTAPVAGVPAYTEQVTTKVKGV